LYAVGPGFAGALLVVHWSAILVALLTLNSLAAPVLAPADFEPLADVLAVAWSPLPFAAAEFEPLVAAPS
jgi:hypothetical protein